MADLHTHNPYLAYATKGNIAKPKQGTGGIDDAQAKGLADAALAADASDFPSAAIAANSAIPQSPSDVTAPTRIQTEP
jgi:hypothetical protein